MSCNELLLAAKISVPKGIKGNFVIKSFLEHNNIFVLTTVDQERKEFPITKLHSLGNNHFLCQSKEITSRNAAISLKDKKIFCFKSELIKLEKNQFFIEDLINLKVINSTTQQEIGYVKNVVQQKNYDIIEIKFTKKKLSKFFLFNKDNFLNITPNSITINNEIL